LRQRWLKAIGRTEETVVSQLRICSAHFKDGEKREGDIPVPDPEVSYKKLRVLVAFVA
jgi:C-terminal binding protein